MELMATSFKLKTFEAFLIGAIVFSSQRFRAAARQKVRVGRLNRIDCYNRSDGVK